MFASIALIDSHDRRHRRGTRAAGTRKREPPFPGLGGLRNRDGERSMAGTQGEFTALMERVRRGSNGAAEELVARYGAHILRVVRAKLSKKLRPKFDSADFVQSVWASFFGGGSDIQEIRQEDGLAAYLA